MFRSLFYAEREHADAFRPPAALIVVAVALTAAQGQPSFNYPTPDVHNSNDTTYWYFPYNRSAGFDLNAQALFRLVPTADASEEQKATLKEKEARCSYFCYIYLVGYKQSLGSVTFYGPRHGGGQLIPIYGPGAGIAAAKCRLFTPDIRYNDVGSPYENVTGWAVRVYTARNFSRPAYELNPIAAILGTYSTVPAVAAINGTNVNTTVSPNAPFNRGTVPAFHVTYPPGSPGFAGPGFGGAAEVAAGFLHFWGLVVSVFLML